MEKTIEAACEIACWYLNDTKLIFDELNLSPEEKDAYILLLWLSKKILEGIAEITPTTISQYGPNVIRLKDRRDPALAVLAENGWVEIKGNVITIHHQAGEVNPKNY